MDLNHEANMGFHFKMCTAQAQLAVTPLDKEIALWNSPDYTVASGQIRRFKWCLPALKAMNVDVEGGGALIESESQVTVGSF